MTRAMARAAALAALLLSCAGPSARTGEGASALGDGLGPPSRALVLEPLNPSSGVDWRPASQLAESLEGAWSEFATETRVFVASEPVEALALAQAWGQLRPETNFTAAAEAPRDALTGPWPKAELDAEGRLEWATTQSPPDPQWAAKLRAQNFDYALLLAPASVEASVWAGQAVIERGGCSQLRARLGRAQEFALADAEAFLDQADANLASAFATALGPASETPTSTQGSCSEARASFDAQLAKCRATPEACPWRPRIYLQGHAYLGAPTMPEDKCTPTRRASLERARQSAVERVLPSLSPRWSERVDRIAALGELDAVLEDGCAARRRRYAPASLAAMQAQLEAIRAAYLREQLGEPARAWTRPSDEGEPTLHVPGLGKQRVYAQVELGPNAPATEIRRRAQSLLDIILSEARCTAPSGELPWLALTVDLRTPAIVDARAVYPESLICEGLGPEG